MSKFDKYNKDKYKEEGEGDTDSEGEGEDYENKNYTNNFKEPSYYNNKLNELDQRFKLILYSYVDNLKKNNLNDEGKSQIDDLNSSLFLLENELKKDISAMNDNIKNHELNKKDILKKNKEYSSNYNDMMITSSGSKGFFDDTKLLYNQYLLSNLLILLVVVSNVIYFSNQRK